MTCNIKQYKILNGRTEFLEMQINAFLEQGWQLHGHTFPYNEALAQVMIYPETPNNQILVETILNGAYNISTIDVSEDGC